MVGKNSVIGRLAVSNLIDTLSNNDFFNVLYVSKHAFMVQLCFLDNIVLCLMWKHSLRNLEVVKQSSSEKRGMGAQGNQFCGALSKQAKFTFFISSTIYAAS